MHPHRIMLPWAYSSPHPKRHLDRFSRFCTAHGREFLYFTMGRPFLQKIAFSHWGCGSPSNKWFSWPIRVHTPNGISIGLSVFAVTDKPTGRQLDHSTPSVTIGRICVRCTAMQYKNYTVKDRSSVLVERRCYGKLFQTSGPQTEIACMPNRVRVRRTTAKLVHDDAVVIVESCAMRSMTYRK